MNLTLVFVLAATALCVASQGITDAGICKTFVKTGYELQVAGPILDDNIHLTPADNVDSCSSLCCNMFDTYTCSVAIYVASNKSCWMIECIDGAIDNGPCQPQTSTTGISMPFVANMQSTLIYILQRNNSQTEEGPNDADITVVSEKVAASSVSESNINSASTVLAEDTNLTHNSTNPTPEMRSDMDMAQSLNSNQQMDSQATSQNKSILSSDASPHLHQGNVDKSVSEETFPPADDHAEADKSGLAGLQPSQINITDLVFTTQIPTTSINPVIPDSDELKYAGSTLPSELVVKKVPEGENEGALQPTLSTLPSDGKEKNSSFDNNSVNDTLPPQHLKSGSEMDITPASSASYAPPHNSSIIAQISDSPQPDAEQNSSIPSPISDSHSATPTTLSVLTTDDAVKPASVPEPSKELVPAILTYSTPSSVENETERVSPVSSSTSPATTSTLSSVPPLPVTTPPLRPIAVSVEGDTTVRLPEDSVVLKAVVADQPTTAEGFDYEWSLIEHPEDFEGTFTALEDNTYKLNELTVGHYMFKVTVKEANAYGEAFVNVTVLEALRVNLPPVAVISPQKQTLTLPTDNAILDGSASSDDLAIERYHWEVVEAPLQSELSKGLDLDENKVLQLKNLVVGNYTFELTVTDADGASNSAQASLIVEQKTDSKPIANAGPSQVVQLPTTSVTLCGNRSTDDWGIVKYSWKISERSKKKVADTQGVRSMCLHLSNLEVGEYTFQLTVTDESGQEATDEVTFVVQPESNKPPVADAGDPQERFISKNGDVIITLNGSKSHDDGVIASFAWKQISGPSTTTIVTPDHPITPVSGFTELGDYVYKLTVTDKEGLTATAQVTVTIKQEQPPSIQTQPTLHLTLPDDVIHLDASHTTDDYGIRSFQWSKSGESPAFGHVLNDSDHKSILRMAGLVTGTYKFNLTVTNIRDRSSWTLVTVFVHPNPVMTCLVELHLEQPASGFSENSKNFVASKLPLLLTDGDDVIIQSVYIEHSSADVVILFYVKRLNQACSPALQVADKLNQNLPSDLAFLNVKIKRVDTYICDNKCSGHGKCHSGSKQCECDIFWMEDFFRVYAGDGVRNCDWSVLYVVIVIFFIVVFTSVGLYFATFCCMRRRRKKRTLRKRKHKTLSKGDYEKVPSLGMKNGISHKNGLARPNPAYQSSSLMQSVTSSSEDNTTLFEKRHLLNSTNRKPRSKNWTKRKKKSSALIKITDVSDSDVSGDAFDGMGLDGSTRVRMRGQTNGGVADVL